MICSASNCTTDVRCRGLCRRHYAHARYHGLIENVQSKEHHGKSGTPEYRTWQKMRRRCSDETYHAYNRYGGRGIEVCDRWEGSFTAFLNDVGLKPSPEHTLDRINVDGNYEPSNVRWATDEMQRTNKSRLNASSIYHGVSWHSLTKKFRARTFLNGETHYLGLFSDEEEAARNIIAFRCKAQCTDPVDLTT
jgi:hypothetical protein